MIQVDKLSIHFAGKTIFDQISFRIYPKDKIGLVGRNGAGKSTLLKVLANQMGKDSGNVSIPTDWKIGYLKQDIDFVHRGKVVNEASKAFEELMNIKDKIELLNKELTRRTDYHSKAYFNIIEELGEYTSRFELLGGHQIQGTIEKTLLGLGFREEEFHQNLSTLSTGKRMRVELAKLILQENEVLLLDEPTNHLDIESILWFEQFLDQYSGAVVLISHDKQLLDRVANRTIEISNGSLFDFKANYSKYVELRKQQIEIQLSSKKNQDRQIAHTEQLIEKFRYKKNKAAFAQSLIKKLDKMERISVEDRDESGMSFNITQTIIPGKIAFTINNVSKSYRENEVLRSVSLTVGRGEKIAFVGQNGQGKSTLVKCLVGEIQYKGSIELGHNVLPGYYAQDHHEFLDAKSSILETVEQTASDAMRPQARTLLGSFMFYGDDVFKRVNVLSGGERARLALCNLLLQPTNTLILDEPTNHLDIPSKEILKKTLMSFDGTLIVISHDRDFLKDLTSKTIEFRNKGIESHLGSIDDFLENRKLEEVHHLENLDKKRFDKQGSQKNTEIKKGKEIHQKSKAKKRFKNQLSKVESKIGILEDELQLMDKKLIDPEEYRKAVNESDFFDLYKKKKTELESLTIKWESLIEKLDGM